MDAHVTIDDLTVVLSSSTVLDGLNFTCRPGERTGITGPIGSGKSTLLRVLIGLQKYHQGTVSVFGANPANADSLRRIRKRTGYLFQDSDDQLFCSTVAEDVSFGLLNQGRSREVASEITRLWLKKLGLDGYENRVVHHLSGGEKRLVALATILVMGPDLLLLDEPFNSLDDAAVRRVHSILEDWSGSVIFVSHEAGRHRSLADRWFSLEQGKLAQVDKKEL